MEGTHGQLGARLTDGLGGHDPHRLPDLHREAGGQVAPVALVAHAVAGLASQHRPDQHPGDSCFFDQFGVLFRNLRVRRDDLFTGLRVQHRLDGVTPDDTLLQGLDHVFAVGNLVDVNPFPGPAVILPDDHVLGDVYQPPGQVAGIGGPESGVRQALAGAVGGSEVLQHRQALPEVGLDGDVDDAARGVGHQAAHARQLADLLNIAAGAGNRHHIDRVQGIEAFHHRIGHLIGGCLPNPDHPLVALLFGDQTAAVLLFHFVHFLVRLGQDLRLVFRDLDVGDPGGNPGPGGILEPQFLIPSSKLSVRS